MKLRIYGFDFVIEYSFLLLISFAVLLNAKDLEHLLLFSALHEIGHITALTILGGRIDRLTLSFYGLALKYSTELSALKEFFVVISGPLVNYLLFLLFGDEINLLLFVINVLPVYPLDGGRVAKILLPNAYKYVSAASLLISLIFSIYLLMTYHSFSLVLIFCYLLVYNILS